MTATLGMRNHRRRHRALVGCIRLDSVVLNRPLPHHTPPCRTVRNVWPPIALTSPQMKRLTLCLSLLLPLIAHAYAPPNVKPMMQRVEASCFDFHELYPYKQLVELNGKTDVKDWDIYMSLTALE